MGMFDSVNEEQYGVRRTKYGEESTECGAL
jgi:hypothetical protein